MLYNYLIVAVRNLLRHKVYTLINVLGLATGMAGCILVVLFVQYEFSYDRHHVKADRIYNVIWKRRGSEGKMYYEAETQAPVAAALNADFPEVEQAVKTLVRRVWIIHEDERYQFFTCLTDTNFVDVFTFPLIHGNLRERLRKPNSVVVTQRFAQQVFGDKNPIGKVISLEYKWGLEGDFTVTGILKDPPQTSSFKLDFDLLTMTIPSGLKREIWDQPWQPDDNLIPFNTYLLLSEGVSPHALERKLPDFVIRYMGKEAGQHNSFHLQKLTRIHLYSKMDYGITRRGNLDKTSGDITHVRAFLWVGFFILLIACINFMNLATARSTHRAREVGMRKVLGAHRMQLIRQFLVESILLSLLALLLALIMVHISLPYLNTALMVKIPFPEDFGLTILGLTGITLFVGLLAGSYPAFSLSAFQPASVLKGVNKVRTQLTWLREGLVVFQFGISIVLIIATLTVYNQVEYIRNKNLGYNKEQVVLLRVFREMRDHVETIKQAFLQNPNILKASVSLHPPGFHNRVDVAEVSSELRQDVAVKMGFLPVDQGFIDTYEMVLVAGRNFSGTKEIPRAILNETAVRMLELHSPVGQQIRMWGHPWEVVGVVKDFHHEPLYKPILPLILTYGGAYQAYHYLTLRIRSENLPETIAFMADQWTRIIPTKPFAFSFLDESLERRYRREITLKKAFNIFSLLAVFVAGLGLFGLTSFTVKQRTLEIGIRKVLGASVSNIMILLSREFMKVVIISNLIAWPIAYYTMERWLQNFAYRIDLSFDIFLIGGFVALIIASVTVGYQTFKAATTNPVDALRYE